MVDHSSPFGNALINEGMPIYKCSAKSKGISFLLRFIEKKKKGKRIFCIKWNRREIGGMRHTGVRQEIGLEQSLEQKLE